MPEPTGGVFKTTPKQGWLIGGAVALGVGAYVWWKHQKAKTAAAAQAPTGAGYGYGYGAGSTYAGMYGYAGFGGTGFYPPYPGMYGAHYGYQPRPPTSNAQWATAAQASLVAQGYDPLTVSAALGVYLTAGTLTQDQVTIIQAAVTFNGDPPVPGPGGYPPAYHSGAAGGGGGGNAQNPVTGLKVTQPGTTGVDIAWNASTGATSYNVTSTHGTVQMLGPTSARIRSINAPGHPTSATVTVLAEPAATGATPATLTIHTS